MSQSSHRSRAPSRSLNGVRNGGRRSRDSSRTRGKSIDANEAYLYALRVAYLSYLLQPRTTRKRHVETRPAVHRSTTSHSFHELMNDFSVVRDSKSTRYPHDFIKELEKRLKGILVGTERRPEYHDALVKRIFAIFLNTLSDPAFKKRMEADRRAEDLVLIFFSNATKELQKGKPPGDEGVKRMVDRHVALFVRLLSLILKDRDWARDKPELASRLQTLESKLLKGDDNLATSQTNGPLTVVEEVVPLTYDVKDMPLVQVVGQIFGLTNTMMQSDINKYKPVWTEKAALQDLKTYQQHLNLGTSLTLNANDFDTQEAYESWKKSEGPELSQLMLAIVQSNPELAKSTPGGNLPQFNSHATPTSPVDSQYAEVSRVLSHQSHSSSYVLDLPADLGSLDLNAAESPQHTENAAQIYTFIPSDPRAMFRFIMLLALSHDLNDKTNDGGPLLSKKTTELLNEIALRWRIPKFTRVALFLDVIREKFVEQAIGLEKLDEAFNYVKDPPQEDPKNKRSSFIMCPAVQDRYNWTIADFALMGKVLGTLHEALLRDLYEAIMTAYADKADLQRVGAVMAIIDEHVQSDPNFTQNREEFQNFKNAAIDGLAAEAQRIYDELLDRELPRENEKWEFYHIQQVAKAVLKLAERVQKRFRKNPEILGINPLMVLLNCTLPAFAEDSKAMVEQILNTAQRDGFEVAIQDGFDLYKELSEFRRVHMEALPHVPFPYKIEHLMADFVWRWIKITEEQVIGWVENAVKQDNFMVRTQHPGQVPTEDERHSTSVIDIYSSFSQVIDQVSQLNWDDDLTYAKFMTALSKALGRGIARYCELLDQMFSREMDRLTPEQEAAATMTRQEKWVQLAKDTWNNKERVEPFQFYPESFVKLNNISFAIQEWDKLESEVNVDACAEVIKKNTPPAPQRPRKTSNYVFTIKIVEAEDLKACDVNGFSDPYVVLTDEYQKRLFKSRIVYRNLNPRWDESVDITTQGPLNLIATIWDWDAVGDHDYVGRTSLKLDPSHFSDFLPREYWLDLDTQGRVMIRVSMEGERDDIQFYFGKAFRNLQRTQRDMTRKITDKLSAYISHCLSRRALRSLLNRGISISSVSSYFNRNRASAAMTTAMPTDAEIVNALKPLFDYFDDNFAIMQQTLTSDAMKAVMTRIWKEVLVTIEGLLVPPLSDKPSQQKALSQQELDVVFKWLQSLLEFFNAVDEDTGEANGVPLNILKNPKYHELQMLNFFYFEPTESLIRESERMASATAANQQLQRTRLSAPANLGAVGGGGLLNAGNLAGGRRAKSIMLSRNLGTMRKAKEEKWKAAQAEPNDDMILRILRMRPEAASYLRDRSRQKERLAAAAAAEMIVRQSLLAGGGRMTGPSVVRR
ncbi:hypothetical protein HRR83_002066 [Exophiala dermatitidis]|uniref:C2 domain-containing protein n=1 Tax=Exophiala dermatitidis TaxID=5970 RepID=A0AAN6EXY7_EXODE|nr:hypothetical protein HRR75_001966 [Exophiala dermatitidis]KAJ4523948.1 hypothetical protein HRR74_002143 [Exophiala dermatitidis]KAJ4525781.1 hypothetical protein HRR73_002513 [Exophiala dermatitidis]KAJ4537110.1 hypothetical protein HRR76_005126 [Exophiala dermatitidis]KAJ4555293.1 hypothetical protein HRR77_001230 [Exophiala dermatitidis]